MVQASWSEETSLCAAGAGNHSCSIPLMSRQSLEGENQPVGSPVYVSAPS